MSTISKMYKKSGGTNYQYTCGDCKNCKVIKKERRQYIICSLSGNEDVVWKKSYLACKFFNVEKVLEKPKKTNLNSGWSQISILDFPDWLPK